MACHSGCSEESLRLSIIEIFAPPSLVGGASVAQGDIEQRILLYFKHDSFETIQMMGPEMVVKMFWMLIYLTTE